MGSVTCDLFQGTFCVSEFSVLNWASEPEEEMLYLSIQKTKGAELQGAEILILMGWTVRWGSFTLRVI